MPYQEPSIERQLVQSQREKKRALLFAKNPIKKVRIVKRVAGLTALFTGIPRILRAVRRGDAAESFYNGILSPEGN